MPANAPRIAPREPDATIEPSSRTNATAAAILPRFPASRNAQIESGTASASSIDIVFGLPPRPL